VTRAREKANLTQKVTTSEPTQLTNGMIWLDTDAVAVSQQSMRWTKTPSGGTTVLSGASDTSITLSYSTGQEQVYANGVLLIRGSDYTASNGTSITLASASVAGDVFEVISIIPLTLVDTYTQAQADGKFVNNTLADAKGDLVVGTADNVISKIAVGSNGQSLVADSTTTSGLRWQDSFVAGKNVLINGGMDIWQRGTSLAVSGGAYNTIADRWGSGRAGSAGNYTISRQLTNDTTNLPFIQYCMRIARNSGDTITGGIQTVQNIETMNSIPYVGKTVTLSAYIRKGADYSGSTITLNLNSGTGTDQNLNVNYTGNAGVCSTTITPTTTWVRYSVTGNVASSATELAAYIYQNAAGTASTANDYIEITGVQLEHGSVATSFARNASTIQGELAACQRYYQRYKADSVFDDLGYSGKATSSTVIYASRMPYVPFRVTPTAVDYANVTWIISWGAGTTGVSAIALSSYASADAPLLTFTTTGLTAGTTYILLAGNTADAYIGLSAEL
jgi:hypothetical protein